VLLFGVAFWLLLRSIRPLGWHVQLAVGILAIWMLTDVRYASYMNSFYMDASALVALFLSVIAGVFALRTRQILWVCAFSGFAVAYAMSKSPHAASAVLAVSLPLALMRRPQALWRRAVLAIAAVAIVAGAYKSLALTPNSYRGQALYNVVFYRILGDLPDVNTVAAELGVRPEEVRYSGTYAYVPESPGRSPRWVQGFYERTGFAKLLVFYARHPEFVVKDLASDLRWAAPQMRAPNVANLRREDGYPPTSLTGRFASWTDVRSALFRWFPAHIQIWYAVLSAVSIIVMRLKPEWAPMAWFMIGLILAAAVEFGVAALADAVETDRHLYVFHAITDVTVIFSAVTVAALRQVRSTTQLAEVVAAGQNAY
jgi:hypothetical protein